jgi:hypothetical protein
MGTNISGLNSGLHQVFWDRLTKTSNTYALSQLWLVGMDQANLLTILSFLHKHFEDYEPNWEIVDHIFSLNDNWFVGSNYYLLARGVTFPGDSIEVSRTGVGQSGNIKGLIGTHRTDLPMVNITFLETNQSFADLFLRPWAILTGHMSLRETELRMPEIELVCFQKDGFENPLKVRKRVILKDAVPINIDNEEYNYTGDKIIDRQINFAYTKYIIKAEVGKDDITKTLVNQITDTLYPPQDSEHPNNIQPINRPTPNTNSVDTLQPHAPVAQSTRVIDKILPPPQANIPKPEQEKSLLEQVKGVLDTAEGMYNTVKGKVENIKTDVARVISVIPGEAGVKATQAVNKAYNTVQQGLGKVGDVISTGQRIEGAAESAQSLGKEITTLGNSKTQNHVPEVMVSTENKP